MEYKILIEYVDGKTGLPMKEEYRMDGPYRREEHIRNLLFENDCNFVDAKVWLWEETEKEWLVDWEKRYYHPNYHGREFCILNEGSHEKRIKNSWAQEMIIHLPSKIIFLVTNREIGYAESVLNNPEILFYKFKYTAKNETVFKFTLLCDQTGCNHSPERVAEIRETVLIPGAKWFCQHFKEAHRFDCGESATDIAFKRKFLKANK